MTCITRLGTRNDRNDIDVYQKKNTRDVVTRGSIYGSGVSDWGLYTDTKKMEFIQVHTYSIMDFYNLVLIRARLLVTTFLHQTRCVHSSRPLPESAMHPTW